MDLEQPAAAETEIVPEPQDSRAEMEARYDELASEGIEDTPEDAPAEAEDDRPRGPDGKFIAKEATEEPAEVVAEEGDTEDAPEAVEAEEDAAEPQAVETPSYLSAELRKHWASIPDEAREQVASTFKEFSDKLATQGRQQQAIQPIADQIIRAANEIPGFKDMTPGQIAQDVVGLAQIQANLHQNPVETILNVAQQYGALEAIKARLEGQQPQTETTSLAAEIRDIKRENERLREQLDPSNIQAIAQQTFEQRDIQTRVTEFAQSRPHYAEVEQHLPSFIGIAKQTMGEGAEPVAILSSAYDMAVNALGIKAQATDAPKPPTADPEKTRDAIKAKSVNVKSASTGKSKPLTARQEMEAEYDRIVNS